MDPLVALEHVSVTHEGAGTPTIRDVSFDIRPGEVVLLVGPSGAGKSTLALVLDGLIPHAIDADLSGAVRIGGLDSRETTPARISTIVGTVFQDPDAQIVTGTVLDEVAFALENLLLPEAEILERCEHALRRMDLWHRRDDDPAVLSGGGRQRLALACALATRAPLLVLDEPTANLDPEGVRDVYAALHDLVSDGEHALLLVEHDVGAALPLASRMLVLDREGSLAHDGAPHELLSARAAELRALGVWLPGAAGDDRRPSPPPVGAEPAVVARGVTLARGRGRERRTVLDDVSVEIPRGAFAAITGPNGAGKTTLAQALAGVLPVRRGSVSVGGIDATRALGTHVGFVFQNPEHQFVAHTVRDELAHDLRRRRLPDDEVERRVDQMLTRLGLDQHAAQHPYRLSGGQKRRLSVGTALIGFDDVAGGVLVLDEPLFGQDRERADELVTMLLDLNARGTTIIVVTHDPHLVRRVATQVIEVRAGRVDGAPSAASAPRPRPRRARWLDRRDPVAKLAAVLPAMVALVFTRDITTPLLFLAAAYLTLLTGARVNRPVAVWLFAALPLAAAVLFAGFSLWTDPHAGGATALRLAALLALALVAGATADGPRLVRSLVAHLGVPYRWGHAALAALRFVPRFRDELDVIHAAQRVRGVGRGPLRAVTRFTSSLVPLLAGGIRHAERVALAMDARAFGAYPTRTEREPARWRTGDSALVIAAWATTVALLVAPAVV